MPLLHGSTGLPLPPEFANLDAADAEEDIAAAVAAASVENGEQDGVRALCWCFLSQNVTRASVAFRQSSSMDVELGMVSMHQASCF